MGIIKNFLNKYILHPSFLIINYRKDKLVKEGFNDNKTEIEIMYSRGYYRIFDCGSRKWVLQFNIINEKYFELEII